MKSNPIGIILAWKPFNVQVGNQVCAGIRSGQVSRKPMTRIIPAAAYRRSSLKPRVALMATSKINHFECQKPSGSLAAGLHSGFCHSAPVWGTDWESWLQRWCHLPGSWWGTSPFPKPFDRSAPSVPRQEASYLWIHLVNQVLEAPRGDKSKSKGSKTHVSIALQRGAVLNSRNLVRVDLFDSTWHFCKLLDMLA